MRATRYIHQGIVPPLVYNAANASYAGHFIFTAEYLLRAVVKVSLAQFGYPDLWRSPSWRAVKAACAELRELAPGGITRHACRVTISFTRTGGVEMPVERKTRGGVFLQRRVDCDVTVS